MVTTAPVPNHSPDSVMVSKIRAPATPEFQIPGFNALLMGVSGSGKTHSIRSLVDCGLEVFVIFTEPGMDLIADIPDDKLHWHYVPPGTQGFETFAKQVETLTKMSWGLIKEQTNDPNKNMYDGFKRLTSTLVNFRDDRTGKEFGSVGTWNQTRVLVIDSLSGINTMAMQFIAGQAIAKSQPQWGAAMGAELNLINMLCYDTPCHFILLAHLERSIDEINGGMIIQANALGRKNAPEIPKNFSDVILTERNGKVFTWSTMAAKVETKSRNLPFSETLAPTFKLLHENWLKRAKKN